MVVQNTAAVILTDLQDNTYETGPDHALGNLDWRDFPSLRRARARLTICGWDKQLNVVFRGRITAMVRTLNLYLDSELSYGWQESSLIAAKAAGHGVNLACNVQRWIHAYLGPG